jgi:hypothetical protein
MFAKFFMKNCKQIPPPPPMFFSSKDVYNYKKANNQNTVKPRAFCKQLGFSRTFRTCLKKNMHVACLTNSNGYEVSKFLNELFAKCCEFNPILNMVGKGEYEICDIPKCGAESATRPSPTSLAAPLKALFIISSLC